jgi:hypothetical protein
MKVLNIRMFDKMLEIKAIRVLRCWDRPRPVSQKTSEGAERIALV